MPKKMTDKQKAEKMFNKIRNKWAEETSGTNGYFIRFIDGDKSNCDIDNLIKIHPYVVFSNMMLGNDFVVDWDISLTHKEIEFVKLNADVFASVYSPVDMKQVA